MATFQERLENQPKFNQAIDINYSNARAFGASIVLGSQESLLLTGSAVVQQAWANKKARDSGIADTSEDDIKNKFHGFIEYREKESPEATQLRYKYAIDRAAASDVASDGHGALNFAGGMLGSGIDLPISLIPIGTVWQVAKGAAIGIRTGRTVSRAATVARKIVEADRVMGNSDMLKRLVAGKSSVIGNLGAISQTAMLGSFGESSLVWLGSKQTGREFGFLDVVADTVLGGAFVTGVASPLAFKQAALARQVGWDLANASKLSNFIKIGDTRGAVGILQKYGDDLGFAIHRDPEISRILNMDAGKLAADPEAQAKLKDFVFGNEDALWLANVKGLIQLDPDLPVALGRAKQLQEVQAVVDAKKSGDTENLSPHLHDVLLDSEAHLARMKGEPVAGINPSSRILVETDARASQIDAEVAETTAELQKARGQKKPSKTNRKRLVKLEARAKELELEKLRLNALAPSRKLLDDVQHVLTTLIPDVEQRALTGKEGPLLVSQERLLALSKELEDILIKHKDGDITTIEAAAIELRAENLSKELSRIHSTLPTVRKARRKGVKRAKEEVEKPPLTREKIEESAAKLDERLTESNEAAARADDAIDVDRTDSTNKKAKLMEQSITEQNHTTIDRLLGGPWGSWAKTLFRTKGDIDEGLARATEQAWGGNKRENLELEKPDDLKLEGEDKIVDERSIDEILLEEFDGHGEVIISIRNIKVKNYTTREVVANYLRGVKGADKHIAPTNISEEASRRALQLKSKVDKGEMTPDQAITEFSTFITERGTSEVVRELDRFHSIRQHDEPMSLLDSAKHKLKFLKTWADGNPRKGINIGGGSIAHDITAQYIMDAHPIRAVLAKWKMLEIFDGTYTEHARVPETTQALWNSRAEIKENATRSEMSESFMEDLATRYLTKETPDHWKGEGQEMFDDIFHAYESTLHSQLAQLNEMGAGVKLRQDHMGLAYRWDNETIIGMGKDQFDIRMLEVLDMARIEESHGGVLPKKLDENGHVTEWEPFTAKKFLDGWFAEIASPIDSRDHSSQNISKSFNKSRMIHVQKGKEFEVMREFSGHKSLARLFTDQVRHRSEMIAIARNLGNEPLPNFEKILKRHGINRDVNTTRNMKGTKLDKLVTKLGVANNVHKADVANLEHTIQLLTGALDNPASYEISFWGKTIRQASHIMFLPLSAISATTDMALTVATIDAIGGGTSMIDVTNAMQKALMRRFEGDPVGLSNYFEGSGAALDAIKNAASRRLALGEVGDGNALSKASDAMFKWNGLEGWTNIMQEAFTDVMGQGLARMARSGDWDIHTKSTMEAMGFTDADFKAMEQSVENVDGIDYLTAQSVAGTDTHRKLLQFFAKFRDQAVLVPDASTQAAIRFGTQSGTFLGEAVRSLLQYQAFPLAMNRVTARQFLITQGGENAWKTGQVNTTQFLGFIAGMLSISMAATALKDMAKLREPRMPWDMSARNLNTWINQSGMGGVIGAVLDTMGGDLTGAMAPVPSTILSALSSDSFGEAAFKSRNLYGGAYPFSDLFLVPLAQIMPDTYKDSMNRSRNFIEREFDTQFLFDTSD